MTANGMAQITECIDIYVTDLRITVVAHILPKTPDLWCLGKIVREHRFEYIWRWNKVPILQGRGITVKCFPTCDVPFITVAPSATPVEAQPGHEVWPLSPSQTESDQTPHGSSLQMGPLGTDGTQIFALYHLWVWPMCELHIMVAILTYNRSAIGGARAPPLALPSK